jgi:hypothetical protein
MPWLTDLATAARKSGLTVVELSGWKTRGHGPMAGVRGVVCHWTATSEAAAGDYPSERIVRDGRSDLPGPLANLGLGRNGTVYVIAAGLAYHAGSGYWSGIGANGNGYALGIEAEESGDGRWSAAMLAAYPRLCAALAAHYRLSLSRVIGHHEWAPSRKVDIKNWPGGMTAFRRTVTNPPVQKESEVELTDKFDPAAVNARPGTVGHMFLNVQQNVAATRQLVTSQGAAITALSGLVAKQTAGLTAAQVEAAVKKAIAESTVDVDINVSGRTA